MKKSAGVSEKLVSPGLPGLQVAMRLASTPPTSPSVCQKTLKTCARISQKHANDYNQREPTNNSFLLLTGQLVRLAVLHAVAWTFLKLNCVINVCVSCTICICNTIYICFRNISKFY